MAVNFVGNVSVLGTNGRVIYRRDVGSQREAEDWISQYEQGSRHWGILSGSIVPIRINNLAEDLLLPTFIHHARKINNVGLRIFASLLAIAWDVATFIPRFLLTPLRALYIERTGEKRAPVYELIKNVPDIGRVLQEGSVKISAQTEERNITAYNDAERLHPATGEKKEFRATRTVFLRELPGAGMEREVFKLEAHLIQIPEEGNIWAENGHFSTHSKQMNYPIL